MRKNAALAALAGLFVRLFFVFKFPAEGSGDSPFYIELAWNWLKNGVYGFSVNGHLTPVDMRGPGYPAFLAAVFAVAGNSERAVMIAQSVVDLGTCFLIAWIAAQLAPAASRRRMAMAGLWLAALCPFTANYSAVVLTETLVTFLTTLAILVLLETKLGGSDAPLDPYAVPPEPALRLWLLGGIVVGFGTLVRPETPLLLIAAGLVLAFKWRSTADWPKLARAGILMAVGVVIPLMPWAARNLRTLHEVQFLAPRHSELPGEYTPLGFSDWTHTWLWRFGDVYFTEWKVGDEPLVINEIPATAFDSPQQKAHVSNLFDQYNDGLDMNPALDQQFADIGRERTALHPLRTYLEIPFLRSLTLWFTPRIELLPYTGHAWPLRKKWDEDRTDFLVTLTFFFLNCALIALAIGGAWIARREPGVILLIAFIVIRTAFFAKFIETPEPRYVLECYPAAIALAAQVFRGSDRFAA